MGHTVMLGVSKTWQTPQLHQNRRVILNFRLPNRLDMFLTLYIYIYIYTHTHVLHSLLTLHIASDNLT